MDVADELLAETYRRGLEPAYAPIVATGKNAATPHALISSKRIEDYVLIDYGVKYKQYCADITRCFFFKSKKAAAIKEKYEKLEKLAYNIIDAGAGMRTTKEIRDYYLKQNPYIIRSAEFEIQTAIQYTSRVANACKTNDNPELAEEINKKLEEYYTSYVRTVQPELK